MDRRRRSAFLFTMPNIIKGRKRELGVYTAGALVSLVVVHQLIQAETTI